MKHIAIIAVLLAALAAGCSGSSPPCQAPDVDKAAVVEASNKFALDLYARLRRREGNLFFAPQSISTTLTMAYAGARGETAKQMEAVLHFPATLRSSTDWIHTATGNVAWDLRHPGSGCEVSAASGLWGQKDFGYPSSTGATHTPALSA